MQFLLSSGIFYWLLLAPHNEDRLSDLLVGQPPRYIRHVTPRQRPPHCVCLSVCAVGLLCLWLFLFCSPAPLCLLCVCCWYALCTTQTPTGIRRIIFKFVHCAGSMRLSFGTVGDMSTGYSIPRYCNPHTVANDAVCVPSNSTAVVVSSSVLYQHRFMPGGNLPSVMNPLSLASVFNRWAEALRYRGRLNVDSLQIN